MPRCYLPDNCKQLLQSMAPLRKVYHLIIFFTIIVFLWLGVWTHSKVRPAHTKEVINLSDSTAETFPKKKVLIYAATMFSKHPIGHGDLKMCSAEVKNYCTISSDLEDLPNADGVLFHSREFDENKMNNFTEAHDRNPEIPYVMMALECPFYTRLHKYRDFFNWTMTYRSDSDVHQPYGKLVKRTEKVIVDYDKIWKSKTKTAFWLVSNMYSTGNRRKELVEKMVKEGLKVDLRGKLYGVPVGCAREQIKQTCEIELHRPYKFTMAFENNNCKEYVTEKFWYKMLKFQMVPIVMTRKIYRDLGIPDSMFIAVDDFGSLKEAVAHVQSVASNKTAYLEYHKWREDFRIIDMNEDDFGYCQLCRKLSEFQGTPKKSYENLKSWFNTSDCDNSFADKHL